LIRQRICYEKRRGTATITLAHPTVNAIDRVMIGEMMESLRNAECDRAIHTLVVQGDGRCFSAGLDLRGQLPEQVAETVGGFHELILAIYNCAIPILARVSGPAMGGGFEIVLACDLAVASPNATFGAPEISWGGFAPAAAAVLRRQVGDKRAAEILLSGRTLTAVDALTMGLVNEVEAGKRGDQVIRSMLERFAALSRGGVEACKRAMRESDGLPLPAALLKNEEAYLAEVCRRPTSVRSSLARRPPSRAR
jgi:enoyl-CoA hydratase/carnithine racemase